MSYFSNSPIRKIDDTLIDRILERGQRLRNAMVQTIVTNDPFNIDLPLDSPQKTIKLDDLPPESSNKIKAFLQGDYMSRQDEKSVFETLRSMSATDLCRATDQTYRSAASCSCSTCLDYNRKDLNCDLRRANNVTKSIQEKYRSNAANLIKYVDSLKISINSVVLNEAGEKKVAENLLKNKIGSISQSFFLEYEIPEEIRANKSGIRSKTDSGLDFGNFVKLCSRRGNQQAIIFKQTLIHDVAHLDKINLSDVIVQIRVYYRHFKQKHPDFLGVAQFSLDSLELTKNFTCNQELSIRFNETTPITLGIIKITLQLGCGRLYFGKEFIDGIKQNKENSVIVGSDDLSDYAENAIKSSNIPKSELKLDLDTKSSRKLENFESYRPKSKIEIKNKPFEECKCYNSHRNVLETQKSLPELEQFRYFDRSKAKNFLPEQLYREKFKRPANTRIETAKTIKPEVNKLELPKVLPELEKQEPKIILFGYLCVSQAKFNRDVLNSFVSTQIFAQGVTCTSNLANFGPNPHYNFTQQIPLIYEENLVQQLRENFMVLEFYEKNNNRDFLIGITKLPLHQFYISYRNQVITKYLSENSDPIVAIDGWEPITQTANDQRLGQVNVLLALGTKEQIDRLPKPKPVETDQKIDIGVQSEIMDEPTKEPTNIETLLNQLVAQKPRNVHVENSTNTENVVTPMESVRSTSELLESLQKAVNVEKKTFKARIAINNAMHLPSRKKCKSKKSKGKKPEDILPSTYVTFEPNRGHLKMTGIVPKCTSPQWDFHCDVDIPTDYLTNSQKMLIFKVWRKSINTTMLPNLQTDVVIGLASVDLTVLSAGLPSVQGWYNITDLTQKCNGQINIHVTPLEPVARKTVERSVPPSIPLTIDTSPSVCEEEEPGELLGRALKRKFTELDEITQRLRLRLSTVTNDNESDTSNDEIADEFERDINTLCVEDDFDMVDFEKEAQTFNLNRKKEVGLLQTDGCNINKQKLDSLLEKLTLLSSENTSRYISGCSQIDTEAMLNDLDQHSRPNIHTSASFDRDMTEKFGGLLELAEKEDEGSSSKND